MRVLLSLLLLSAACRKPPATSIVASPSTVEVTDAGGSLPSVGPDTTDAATNPVAAVEDPGEPPPVSSDFIVIDAGTKLGNGLVLGAPCVNPSVHASMQATGNTAMVGSALYQPTDNAEDLDGDGTSDIVIGGGAARWEVVYYVYVRRGACGHYVGQMSSSDFVNVLKTRTKGLLDIRTATDDCTSLGGLGQGYCEIVWRFDGRIYVPGPEKKITKVPRGIQP